MLLTTTPLLSQRAEPWLVWFRLCRKTRIGRGTTSIFRFRCDKAKRGCASHVPPSPGAPHETGDGGGSAPPFFDAGASPASVNRRTQWRTINTRLRGRSLHSDPCGKAEMLKSQTRVVLLNLVLTAPGLRAWLSPWLAPGNRSLGLPYSKGSRSSSDSWSRYRAQSSIRTRRRSNRSERA